MLILSVATFFLIVLAIDSKLCFFENFYNNYTFCINLKHFYVKCINFEISSLLKIPFVFAEISFKAPKVCIFIYITLIFYLFLCFFSCFWHNLHNIVLVFLKTSQQIKYINDNYYWKTCKSWLASNSLNNEIEIWWQVKRLFIYSHK